MLKNALRLLLAPAVLLAASCTADDAFKLRQPEWKVELQGALNVSAAPSQGTCVPGTTFYWGQVRNIGDLDVEQVKYFVDVFDAGGGLFGTFSASVFSGTPGADAGDTLTAVTSLKIDQVGTFLVCTTVPWGSAARAESHVEAVPVDTSSTSTPL